jgi:Protein of unknown function (DUF1236)
MRPSIRRVALAVAALAIIGFASGTQFARWVESSDSDDVTGSLGPTAARHAQLLPLTDEERAQIFDGVMRIGNAPVADISPPAPAQTVPKSVALQDLPAGVAQQVPLVQGYKFVKLDDRILLVNPTSRIVVAWMPRYKLVLN